ncbi:hypothetical protein L1275_002985 [Flavobacterium sp. HSC-61S13]|nr:hypothetical protein [Flavobacterium sp. HSC-61S13]
MRSSLLGTSLFLVKFEIKGVFLAVEKGWSLIFNTKKSVKLGRMKPIKCRIAIENGDILFLVDFYYYKGGDN